jgi:hypothetical protein
MSEREEYAELEGQLELGAAVETFLGGQIGRYLIQRAETERAEALEALKDVNPEDAAAVRALQNRVRVVDTVQQWLADTISQAAAAFARLERMDSDREENMD